MLNDIEGYFMHTRLCKYFFAILAVTLLFCSTASAEDRVLSLVAPDADDPTVINISVDNAQYIAGASFTVTYDTASLTLNPIESDFFQTFAEQITPDPGCVTVDQEYCSPIVSNIVSGLDTEVSTGTMLAAATIDRGTNSSATLFTLDFKFTENTMPGEYAIAIEQSKIYNPSAGYDTEGGELIPMLVGLDDAGNYPAYDVPSLPEFIIDTASIDKDVDGIDDIWEVYYRPDGLAWNAVNVLEQYTATTDVDGDGYSDYQEYMNWSQGIDDPNGAAFDPAGENAPRGEGYEGTPIALPAVNLLLLTD